MTSAPRYAIYYAPAPGSALARFGASVLGYDSFAACDVPYPDALAQAFPRWREIAAEPARYGFHATLKAPFELEAPAGEHDILAATEAIARRLPPLDLGMLDICPLDGFVALVPSDQEAVQHLAADVVQSLDHLRAPLTDADRARRLKAPLSARQQTYLDAWGYPYVLDEFRFHMTLTGSLDADQRHAAREALAMLYEPLQEAVVIDAIAVFRQRSRAERFTTIARFALGGASN